jgi:hypothetical protein
MGDLRVFNSAGESDDPNTVTSYNSSVGRISDLFVAKEDLQDLTAAIENNTNAVQGITQGSSSSFDTFSEVEENLSIDAFLSAWDDE